MTTGPEEGAITEDFTVVYDGDALRDHRMNVRELAPALLALADLFVDVNGELNPGEPPVTLNIRGTGEGSFVVDLTLVAGVVGPAITLLSGDPATALANLQSFVVGARGVVSYLKNRGRDGAVEEVQPDGQVKVTLPDGMTLEYPAKVHELGNNMTVRERVREVVAPVTREGIDRVDFHTRSTDREVSVSITKDDAPAFYVEPDTDEEHLDTSEVTMVLEIVNLAFRKKNKWRVTDGSNKRGFFVTVLDQRFLDRWDKGLEEFRSHDLLRAVVRFRQVRTADGLKLERDLVRIEEHIKYQPPDALPYPNGEQPPLLG